jgi:hypothetical protein
MNCEMFDSCISDGFDQYGKIGAHVQLLTVRDSSTPTPPYDWISVTLEVTPVVPNPIPYADTWYFGGVIRVERGRVPLGVRFIDRRRLIGCCEAAKKLPPGFPLPEASGGSLWPVCPGCHEPFYRFQHDSLCIDVGAYTGRVYESE